MVNSVIIDSISGNSTGGVVSYNDSGTVTNCYNTGIVIGGNATGGVVGVNNISGGLVTNCYNTGIVIGGDNTGGVVGSSANHSTVTNCYNTGNVSGNTDVGGVVGYLSNATVNYCYYLDGCAKDGQSVTQTGLGVSTINTAGTDSNGTTNAFTGTGVSCVLSSTSGYNITDSASISESIAAGAALSTALNTWVASTTYNTWISTAGYPIFGALYMPMTASALTVFASQTVGYVAAPALQTVTITNTGNQAIYANTADFN